MVNHVAITVKNWKESKAFYTNLLGMLGYEFKADIPIKEDDPESYFGGAMFGNDDIGTWVNIWQMHPKAQSEHYRLNVGLNHLAFHADSRALVNSIGEFVSKQKNCELIEPPKEYPYGKEYYAVFFKELNGIKLEVVHHN